jgi:hypothetical protein
MIAYGTDEWYAARLGKVTASRGACLLVNGRGPHGLGEGALTYAGEIVRGMMGIPPDEYTTPEMAEGVRREEESIEAYEAQTFRITDPGEFLLIPGTIIGATPDAFVVGESGLVQAKNPSPKAHMETLLSRELPSKYRVQVQWEMMVADRNWCDFISYNPAFPDQHKLVIIREMHDRKFTSEVLRPRIDTFIGYVNELKSKLNIE